MSFGKRRKIVITKGGIHAELHKTLNYLQDSWDVRLVNSINDI